MNRRDFIGRAGCAALAGLFGCRTGRSAEDAALRAAMGQAVADGLFTGIVATSNRGTLECAGLRTLTPAGGPVTANSMFDLASVGKTQTAALCALLYAQGKLDPDAPFTKYVPEHVLAKESCTITLRDLATHSGGFDNTKPYMVPDKAEYMRALYAKRPVRPRGERHEYACVNFVYLGLAVEKVTGLDLDTAARRLLWEPLGMTHTTWQTIVGNPDAVECHPSTYRRNATDPLRKVGEHNDWCAHWAPRPMGNGSCFSTAPDMLGFAEDLLERKRFPKAYYDLLLKPSYDKDGVRYSFGLEMRGTDPNESCLLGTVFSDAAVCHTGWTGTLVAVDPKLGFAGVVLGSRSGDYAKANARRMRLMEMMT